MILVRMLNNREQITQNASTSRDYDMSYVIGQQEQTPLHDLVCTRDLSSETHSRVYTRHRKSIREAKTITGRD